MSQIYHNADAANSYQTGISSSASSVASGVQGGLTTETNISGQKNGFEASDQLSGVMYALSAVTQQSANMITEVSNYLKNLDREIMR